MSPAAPAPPGADPLCYVNGVRRPLPPGRADATLLEWLRTDLALTGTKLACGEGGCGACTVILTPPEAGAPPRPANACLLPLYAADAHAVTTIEGLGGGPAPLHPLQAALAAAHGSQCGFCTPGFVMAAAAALAERAAACGGGAAGCPRPAPPDIEDVLAGNLCRCTGYRPIVDAFRPFFGGEAAAAAHTHGGAPPHAPPTRAPHAAAPPLSASCPPLPPPPPELVARGRPPLHLPGPTAEWHRPTTLAALLALKAETPAARLIGGNTEVGIEVRQKGVAAPVLVDVTAVPDLARVAATPAGLSIGAAVSLARLQAVAADVGAREGARGRSAAALARQLRWFAGGAVRASGTLGGNVATASPIADVAPILLACGAVLTVARLEEAGGAIATREVAAAAFWVGYRRTALAPTEALVSVLLPWTAPHEHVLEFKVARRRDDDIAIVNGCGRAAFAFDPSSSSWSPSTVALAYGGVADRTTAAPAVAAALAGAGGWGAAALAAGLTALPTDVSIPPSAPGGMAAYRTTLAASFLARFIAVTHAELTVDAAAAGLPPPPPLPADLAAAADPGTPRPPPSGLQYYDAAAADGAVIGAAAPHRAATLQASGEALYLADLPLPATALHAALVPSTRPHARVVNVDASPAATGVPGFVAFYGAADVPGSNAVGPFAGDALFADGVVLCVGHPVGVVVAATESGARAAAAAVAVTYEDLPSIISVDDAVAAASFFDFPGLAITAGDDVEAALAASDVVVAGELRIGGQEHFYLEPNCALALPGEAGEMTVWSSTQAPAGVQKDVAAALGVPAAGVDVKVKRVGGGFGGKETRAALVAAAAAVAAARSRAPVRLVLDRHVDMVVSGTRHPFVARWRVGAAADGALTAADVAFYSNGGCSPDLSAPVMQRALLHAANAYRVPRLRAVGTVCRTHLPSATAFRGFGAPQAMLAMEAALDQVAAAVAEKRGHGDGGGDARLAVRGVNLVVGGDVTHYGTPLPPSDTHARACWDGVLASSDAAARLAAAAAFNAAHRWRKRGVAAVPTMFGASFTHKPYNQAGALVHIQAADGSVRVAHGGVEMGQGLHTKVAAVAAAALDVPPAAIHIVDTATDAVANASPTAASVSSDLYGGAVAAACAALAARLAPYRAAHPASFPAAVAAAHADRVDLTAHGFYTTPGVEGYGTTAPFAYCCYGAAVAEVELDVLTGGHTTLRADVVMDVGAPVNPALDVGQVEGAFVQGAGWVTTEDVVRGDGDHAWLPRGATHTRGPGTYKLPSAADAPADFRVTLLRGVRCGATPLTHASKAVGEPPFFLGASVFFALRAAVAAARTDVGLSADFTLHSPATAEALRLACGGDVCAAAAGVGREGVAVRPSC